jgi:hypothetical protein
MLIVTQPVNKSPVCVRQVHVRVQKIILPFFSLCFVVPPQTALHWAAKHGNGDVVKLIAGTYQADVNARSVSVPRVTIPQDIGRVALHEQTNSLALSPQANYSV